MEILGIEINSRGVSGGIVDTEKGEICSALYKTSPLHDTSPPKILSKIHEVTSQKFNWKRSVSCAFPAPVHNGIVLASNYLDNAWIDTDAKQLFEEITDNPFFILQNTDAAGLAEIRGEAKSNTGGLIIFLSVEKHFGSSLFLNRKLISNTQLGLLKMDEGTIKSNTPEKICDENGIKKLQNILEICEKIFHPDQFILAGKTARLRDKIFPYIKIKTPFKAAKLQNAAIIGAAIAATGHEKQQEVFYR